MIEELKELDYDSDEKEDMNKDKDQKQKDDPFYNDTSHVDEFYPSHARDTDDHFQKRYQTDFFGQNTLCFYNIFRFFII